jgi:hypothetical protein
MNLNLRGMMLVFAAVMGLLFSGEARAQSCSTLMQDRLNWMTSYDHYLDIQGTSLNATQSNGWGLASYIQGSLYQYTASSTYYDFVNYRWVTVPAKVSGQDIKQTFSDRYATGYQPFNKNAADLLGISIDANGKIVITLQSWGNGTVTISTTACMNDVIYGSAPDGTHWSFRLLKGYIPG